MAKRIIKVDLDKFEVEYTKWGGPDSGVPAPEAYVSVNGHGMLVFDEHVDRMIAALTAVREQMRADANYPSSPGSSRTALAVALAQLGGIVARAKR